MKPKSHDVNHIVLSLVEAAEIVGIAPSTLKQHLNRGHLPGKKLGRDWALLRADVEAFTPAPRGRPPAD